MSLLWLSIFFLQMIILLLALIVMNLEHRLKKISFILKMFELLNHFIDILDAGDKDN